MHKIIAVIVDYKSKIKQIGVETIIVDNNKINRGFAKGANIGIKKALKQGATKVLLINPDADITKAAILKLCKSNADIVSPVLRFERQGETVLDFGGKVNWLLGRTTHNENTPGKIDFVSGACMLINSKVFEKIGYFDERFFMYFEDVDFCLRAKSAGLKVAIDPVVVADHQISEHKYSENSIKKGYLLASNKYFMQKWLRWYAKLPSYAYIAFLRAKIALYA